MNDSNQVNVNARQSLGHIRDQLRQPLTDIIKLSSDDMMATLCIAQELFTLVRDMVR